MDRCFQARSNISLSPTKIFPSWFPVQYSFIYCLTPTSYDSWIQRVKICNCHNTILYLKFYGIRKTVNRSIFICLLIRVLLFKHFFYWKWIRHVVLFYKSWCITYPAKWVTCFIEWIIRTRKQVPTDLIKYWTLMIDYELLILTNVKIYLLKSF